MISWFRNIFIYLVCAVAATGFLNWMGSPLISDLSKNLTAIVLALLAINVQTTAVIAVKLRDILDKSGGNANATIEQFRLAIIEQAVLLLLALFLQGTIGAQSFQLSSLTLSICCLFIFFATVHIFLDTSIGLLIALFPENT